MIITLVDYLWLFECKNTEKHNLFPYVLYNASYGYIITKSAA